jgi:hypothetical protein
LEPLPIQQVWRLFFIKLRELPLPLDPPSVWTVNVLVTQMAFASTSFWRFVSVLRFFRQRKARTLMTMRVMAMRDVETAIPLFAPVERVLSGVGVIKTVGAVRLLREGDGGGGDIIVTAGVTVLLGEGDPDGDEDDVAEIDGCRVDGGEEIIVAASAAEVMAAMDRVGKRGVAWAVAASAVAVEASIERDRKGGVEKSDPELEMKVAAASEEERYDEDAAPDMESIEIEVIGLDIIISVAGPRRRSNVTDERPSPCKDARDNSEGKGPRDTSIDCEAVMLIAAGECANT